MAKDTTSKRETPQKPQRPQPLAVTLIKLPLRMISFLFFGFLVATIISIIIEIIGLTFFWPDDMNHAQKMFFTEYEYIKSNHMGSLGKWQPITFMEKYMAIVYNILFESSFSKSLASWWNQPPASTFGGLVKGIFPHMAKYAEAVVYIILTIAMRVSIFVLSFGWFILCGVLGLVYGLVQREIRKEEGGLEHSYVFHMAKSNLSIPLQFGWVIYLSSPFAIYPSIVIIPAGIAFGYLIALTASTFKKYL